ncbi:centromere protein X-like [Planoprotostelium fungivorum]|uniref:Centromere protein X-like n=1 Tax=Planoprotostelium fungivorum TaxID=1890364 RepID=A0A2P6MTA5_9EUKA|nr:centromere protein X-like [Planoprotostelium fungivorum]
MNDDANLDPNNIKLLLQKHWREGSTRISKEALIVATDYVQIFVQECLRRAHEIASVEGSQRIETAHLEKVAIQMLLDF